MAWCSSALQRTDTRKAGPISAHDRRSTPSMAAVAAALQQQQLLLQQQAKLRHQLPSWSATRNQTYRQKDQTDDSPWTSRLM